MQYDLSNMWRDPSKGQVDFTRTLSDGSTFYVYVNATQRNTTQHNTTQHNTTQHNTTQHNTTQHNTTQRNVTQRDTTRVYLDIYNTLRLDLR